MTEEKAAMRWMTPRLTGKTLGCIALALICGSAAAQPPAPAGPGGLGQSKAPIDVTADSMEMIDAQHLQIWHGNVEAVQSGDRLVSDVLNVYFAGPAAAPPGAPPAPKSAAPAPGVASISSSWGAAQKLVADGHVFYVSGNQTARGDHAVYDMVPNIITMTGNVVLVQGQDVVKGDTLIFDRNTNHANVISNVQGRNHPERVRAVFYNNDANGPGAAAAPGAAPAKPAKPAAAPAKPAP